MVAPRLHRRQILTALAAFSLVPDLAGAESYVDLDWADLLPANGTATPPSLRGIITHDQTTLSGQQSASSGVRTDWNGMIVRLPGFIVPLDYSGTGVTAFILVPFVGACVHVPPPPANQLVLVSTTIPYQSKGLFEPVNVIGMFGAASTTTQLAEIGYALSADLIEPYRT